jgi:DNA modification methylase
MEKRGKECAMQITFKPLSELIPYSKNPRKNDEAVEFVANSIKEFGFKVPIVIDGDGIIVAGHTRYKAAKKLKLTEVPCIIADDLTEEQIKAYRLADNRVAEKSEWDIDLLSGELDDILNIDMAQFDFDLSLDEEETEVAEDDFDGELPEEPKSKLGDIYQLGNHRLMCGDSTSIDDVEKLMNGVKADMVFTDPPYNVDYSNADRPKASKTDLGRIKNDVMDEEDFIYFLSQVYKRLDENTKEDSSFYIWYADKSTIAFYSALYETDIEFKQLLIWKKPMLLGRSKYQWAHEPCIFAIKGSPYFTEDRTKTTVWDFGGYDKSKNVHPTQKPLFLPTEALNNSSKKEDIILDVFGGSGSTLIACEQLNRNCYMMELDPKYVDVIINRWEQFTGQQAELIEEVDNGN